VTATPAATPALPAVMFARNDQYDFKANRGERLELYLDVLKNDVSRDFVKIFKVSTRSDNYGNITMTNTNLIYTVDNYDGRVVTSRFK
jgi:hypothetical protein